MRQRSNKTVRIVTRKQSRDYIYPAASKGFTAIELIVVIVILSILTITIIIKNPFGIQDYSSIAADQLIADIEYAQLRAMGKRNTTEVRFFVDPGDYGKYELDGKSKKLTGGITVTSISLTNPLAFNSLGEPSSNGTITLSGGKTIRVYASTGKAEIE